MTISKSAFRLGKLHFRLSSDNASLLDALGLLLPVATDEVCQTDAVEPIIIELPQAIAERGAQVLTEDCRIADELFAAISYTVNQALAFHRGYLWLDASLLVNSRDQLTLITGQSNTGKTTLTLTLWFLWQWRVMAEDITVIDQNRNVVIPFARPLSLRPGTLERVSALVGAQVSEVICGEWYFNENAYLQDTRVASFRYAFHLNSLVPDNPGNLSCRLVLPSEHVRILLKVSNTIHLADGAEDLYRYLENCLCYVLDGGTLAERVAMIREITLDKSS